LSINEQELLKILDELNLNGKKFALSNVLRSNGKENGILIKWSKKYKIHKINRKYTNSNYQKKNLSEAEEVLITNY
jgi:site-specific DNA-adenine methylase